MQRRPCLSEPGSRAGKRQAAHCSFQNSCVPAPSAVWQDRNTGVFRSEGGGEQHTAARLPQDKCACAGLRARACLPVLGPRAAAGAAGRSRSSERRRRITDRLQYLRQGLSTQQISSLLQGSFCMLRHLQWRRRGPRSISALRSVRCSRAGRAAGVRRHGVRRQVSRRLCNAREPLPSRQPLPQLSAGIFLNAMEWADAAGASAGTRLPARHWQLMLRHDALEMEFGGGSPAVDKAKDWVLVFDNSRP